MILQKIHVEPTVCWVTVMTLSESTLPNHKPCFWLTPPPEDHLILINSSFCVFGVWFCNWWIKFRFPCSPKSEHKPSYNFIGQRDDEAHTLQRLGKLGFDWEVVCFNHRNMLKKTTPLFSAYVFNDTVGFLFIIFAYIMFSAWDLKNIVFHGFTFSSGAMTSAWFPL